MGIEYLNRFHWILIGAFLGTALAWAWASTGDNIEGMQSVAPQEFERDVIQKDGTSGRPLVFGIIVHPPQYSPQDDGQVNLVTYKRLAKHIKTGQYWWIDKFFVAKIPYTPAFPGRVAGAANMSIDKYLTELAKTNNAVKFSNAWWMQPKNAAMLGGGAGIILIGGIWPTLLNLMTGAGLGKKPEPKPKKKEKPLWQYKSAPVVSAKPVVSARDAAEMAEVTGAYERSVGDMAADSSTAVATVDDPAKQPAEVRKLQVDTETVDPAERSGDDDQIEVKEKMYYPVLIHHQKKAEDKDDKSKDSPSRKDE